MQNYAPKRKLWLYPRDTGRETRNLLAAPCKHRKGRRGIPLPLLLQLREQFNVSADYLIYGTANENDITDLMAMLEGVDEAVYPYVKESVISLLKLWNYKKDNPGESCG